MAQVARKAYIVGAAQLSGDDHLPGVKIDKVRMRAFLLSDHGGAWEPHEIDIQEKPFIPKHHGPAPSPVFDYVLYFFAGHGFTRSDDTHLCVNDHQDVALNSLLLSARRQLVIIDACRTPVPEPQVLTEKMAKAVIAGTTDYHYRARCRALYDQSILAAEKGRTIVFACSPGESAGDSGIIGGHFTYNLVTGTESWIDRQRPPGPHILHVPAAVRIAKSRLDPMLQNPVYEGGRRLFHFPFAVVP
ncbi:caspase family protein [Myxococcota bacterium]|nr:caspase family protein [Myxococcota bacterium]